MEKDTGQAVKMKPTKGIFLITREMDSVYIIEKVLITNFFNRDIDEKWIGSL